MDLNKITDIGDLDYFVKYITDNDVKINDKKNLLLSIRAKTDELILKKGDIPPSNWIKLYSLFRDVDVEKDSFVSQNIDVLLQYYPQASTEEKVLLNNVIFILKTLNGEDWFKEFVYNYFTINIYSILNNPHFEAFHAFLSGIDDAKLLIETVEYILDNMPLKEVRTIKNIYANLIAVMWNVKILTGNKIWLEIFDRLVKLNEAFIKNDNIEAQMTNHFFTYHVYGNNIQTIEEWRKFNEYIEKPASEYYIAWGERNLLSKCKKRVSPKRKKIGFLIDRIVNNSPMKVIYSLLKELKSNEEFNKNYDIYFYSMCYAEKQTDNMAWVEMIKSLGVEVYSTCEEFKQSGVMYPHLEKALKLRDRIIKDKIDYLVTTVLGYDIPNFIFSNRSAPRQIFWSHGNCTTDIENIDLRISHFQQECNEYEWRIFNVPIAEEFLIGSEEDRKKAEILKKSLLETYGKDTVFLGTIGRYIKIDSDEYLKVIAEIMKQNPNTIYLACGDGNVESIKEKLKKYDIPPSRFVFTGLVNPHIFGWIIDVWINTFPLSQGHSQEEYHAKGNGVVIQGEFLINCKEKNDYEHIMEHFLKNRADFFEKVFEVDRNEIDENVSYDMLRFNIYKKYNPDINEENILKCIKYVDQANNCKEKWFRIVDCIIQNKDYFNMHKWISYKLWEFNRRYKNNQHFLKKI